MRTNVRIIMLLLLVLGLGACQTDDDIYEMVPGGVWVGDLGFVDDYGEPLESGLVLEPDGFGVDEQCFYDGEPAFTLNVRWWIEYGTLFLDYGKYYPVLEIRNVYVDRDYLSGRLYVEGRDEGSVRLERY